MKISIIQPRISYYIGGGEKLPLIHAELLSQKGHEVVIFTTKVQPEKQTFLYKALKSKKIKNIEFKEFDIPLKYKKYFHKEAGEDRNRWDTECLLFNQLIFSNLESSDPDILISYYVLDGLFKPLKITSILYLLGYPNDDLEIRTSFLRFYDATISISKNVHNKWERYFNSKSKNYILNSGVDLDNQQTSTPSDFRRNIVFAGRLVERKGVETLLEAFHAVIEKHSDVHLWIIGDGPKIDDYSKTVKGLNLENAVTFTGSVSNIKDYFRMSDICVFPSYEKEGLMGVVLEAMSAGKPVITTTNNGNEDVIIADKTGILVEPKNSTSLAGEIMNHLQEHNKMNIIGKNAKKYIENHLTWDIFIEKFNKLLFKIKY